MVDLHAAVSEDPEHLLLRGLTFADLERPEEAKELLSRCSERLQPEQWSKQVQIIEAQVRLADLVQARMAMGRIPTEHSSDPEIQRLKNRMDSDFVRLAKTESPKVLPGDGNVEAPELMPGVYLAEPGKLPTIAR
jgi:hypothetical protein